MIGEECRPKAITLKNLKKLEDKFKGKQCRASPGKPTIDEDKLQELNEIKEEQFYLEKLKGQREKIENLREDYEKKEEQLTEKEALVAKLKRQIKNLETLKPQYDSALSTYEKQGFQLKRLLTERNDLQNLVNKFVAEDSQNEVDRLNEEIADLEAQQEGLELEVQRLEKSLQGLKEEKFCLQGSFKEQSHNLKSKWETLRQELQDLKNNYREEEDRKADFQVKIKTLTEQYESLLKQIEDVKHNETKLEMAIDNSEKSLLQLRSNNERCLNQLTKEVSSRQVQISRLQGVTHKQRVLLTQFKKREEENDQKVANLMSKVERTNEQCQLIQLDIKRKDNRIFALEEESAKNKGTIAELKQKLSSLEKASKCRSERNQGEKRIRSELQSLRSELQKQKLAEVEMIDELVNSFHHK